MTPTTDTTQSPLDERKFPRTPSYVTSVMLAEDLGEDSVVPVSHPNTGIGYETYVAQAFGVHKLLLPYRAHEHDPFEILADLREFIEDLAPTKSVVKYNHIARVLEVDTTSERISIETITAAMSALGGWPSTCGQKPSMWVNPRGVHAACDTYADLILTAEEPADPEMRETRRLQRLEWIEYGYAIGLDESEIAPRMGLTTTELEDVIDGIDPSIRSSIIDPGDYAWAATLKIARAWGTPDETLIRATSFEDGAELDAFIETYAGHLEPPDDLSISGTNPNRDRDMEKFYDMMGGKIAQY